MSESFRDEQWDNLPESDIRPRSKFSIVWLVPLVALLIGAWIAYKAWSEMGPTIMITFKTAEGLEAGKTKIKYKNVEIGQVTSISLNHETDAVEVTAEMNKNSKPFLTDRTRFWVVSARINASGVSGLETLLAGAYIGIDPNTKGKSTRRFIGLDIPPVITQNIPGKHFILHTKDLGSLKRDIPVYYRKFSVGLVEDVKLTEDGSSITVRIFIREPYDRWVKKNTKFWNASGIDFSMSANGINMQTESLVSILVGGIAFESHDHDKKTEPADNGAEFKLYANREETLKRDYKIGPKYVVNFSESVRGLTVGAPVEFRGIQVGEVTDIELVFDTASKQIRVPVTARIDYERIAFKGNRDTAEQLFISYKERTDYFVKHGLRAQLQTGNLITGQLYVELDFFPSAPPAVVDWNADIPEFPAVPGVLGAVKQDITSILKKMDKTMTQVKELSYKLNHTLEPEISAALKQAEKSLGVIENTLKNDSPLQQDLQITLREMARTARSVRNLADYLERHPESLIEGKKGN